MRREDLERTVEVPETKSKRLAVLVTPTLYEALKDYASISNQSMNKIVSEALIAYLLSDQKQR